MKFKEHRGKAIACKECGHFIFENEEYAIVESEKVEVSKGIYHLKCIDQIMRKERRASNLMGYLKIKQLELDMGVF